MMGGRDFDVKTHYLSWRLRLEVSIELSQLWHATSHAMPHLTSPGGVGEKRVSRSSSDFADISLVRICPAFQLTFHLRNGQVKQNNLVK